MLEKVLANIMQINPNLSAPFVEGVLNRLVSLGYTLKETDAWLIGFCMNKTENHIKSYCNITIIPDQLLQIAIDQVCGEFLLAMKQTGQLQLANLDLTAAVKSIQEGDTTVQFNSGSSDAEKLDQFIKYLISGKEGDLVCFRRLKW